MDSKEKIQHNQILKKCVAEWQRLLKLDEWNIAIGISSKEQMNGANGSISYVRENGQALITVIDKDDAVIYPFGYNEEETIIRQLLELRYETLGNGDDNIYLARSHKIMAKLLADLKYKADAYNRVIDEMSNTENTSAVAPKTSPRIINP